MRRYGSQQRNTFRDNVIHVGVGFVAKERPHVVATLSTLGPQFGKWEPRDVDLEVSLQDRGGKEQRVTLRTILPGHQPLVAVAVNPDINRALSEAKRELIRQLEHQKSAQKPMNNRRLRRATIRHPSALMASAQSMWDSEGGAAERGATGGEGGSAPGGAEGSQLTPTRLGRIQH